MSAKLIKRASDCTVDKFLSCKFDGDLEVLIVSGTPLGQELFDAWDTIHCQYIDLTGTFIPELDMMKRIKVLECRNMAVEAYLSVVENCVNIFKTPYLPDFPELEPGLKELNVNLPFDGNLDSFKNKLSEAKTNEKRYIIQLNKANKELEDYRKKQSATPSHDNSREEFIRLLLNLQKPPMNFKIDRKATTVEELGIMVHDFFDYIQKSKKSSNN